MITEIFRQKFAMFVEWFEGRELKIYPDSVGVPTIGVGFALINRIEKGTWTAYDQKFLIGKGINITDAQHKIIVQYAALKSDGKSTAHLNPQLKAFDLTITNDIADQLVQYVIKDKYDDKILKSIGEQVWDSLSFARQMAIMDHSYHSGNIDAFKDDIITGNFEKLADTIRNRGGDKGLKARYTLRAKMIEEDQFSFQDVYIVKIGDNTFSDVAKKYNISASKLKELNPQIKNIDEIFKGQMINVPTDFFKEHYQELNTIISSNVEFNNTFNHYKYDSFLNIYYNKADAFEYIKGARSIGGESQKISVPASSGEFYISLQVANYRAAFFTVYPIDKKFHASYTKPLITDIKRDTLHVSVDTSLPNSQASQTPPMSIKRIGLADNQYREAMKCAQSSMIGEIGTDIEQIAQQDTIAFVQSVYNKAGLPNHFASLYTASELKNLKTENALKLLREHGSRETVEDSSSLLRDLSQVLPITTNEWISKLNTALYKNFTPSPLLPQKLLTSEILSVSNTNSVEVLYQSLEVQRQGALILKQFAEKGYTFDKLPPAMQESLKFLNFIKFNDLVLFFNKTISIVQDDCNKLLDQISDKSSDDYLKATKYVNNTITELKNKAEQLTSNIANNFYYMKEVLETNKDIKTLCHNITSQEASHINKIETLLRIGTAHFTTEEYHEEASHRVKRDTYDQKIDNEKIKTHDQISNNAIEAEIKFKDALLTDTNIAINLGNTALGHIPLLSDDSNTNLVSTANISNVNINSVLMLGNLVVRMINKSDNKTTNNETIIHNDTACSEDAHDLAYSSYKSTIDDNEDNVDLLG